MRSKKKCNCRHEKGQFTWKELSIDVPVQCPECFSMGYIMQYHGPFAKEEQWEDKMKLKEETNIMYEWERDKR